MVDDVSLTPHLEQFIREQVATGCFQSETEVIRTALVLLEEQFPSQEASQEWLKHELDKGLCSHPSEPATKQFWAQQRERLRQIAASDHAD